MRTCKCPIGHPFHLDEYVPTISWRKLSENQQRADRQTEIVELKPLDFFTVSNTKPKRKRKSRAKPKPL